MTHNDINAIIKRMNDKVSSMTEFSDDYFKQLDKKYNEQHAPTQNQKRDTEQHYRQS